LAMFDATRFIHRHLLCLYGFGLGLAAIDICHGKTVRVPHHVAVGKFLGAPWGRKAARHSTSLRPLALSLISGLTAPEAGRKRRLPGSRSYSGSCAASVRARSRHGGASLHEAKWGKVGNHGKARNLP
jgi:hypothetical protein